MKSREPQTRDVAGKIGPSLPSVAGLAKDRNNCSDGQGASVHYLFPRREPSDQDKAANLATKFEVNGWPCVAVGTNGSPIQVLLIDGFVVGRLTQIPWLASHGFRLVSVSGRGPIEAPSLPALVREWLAQHGALLTDRRERGIR